MIRALHRLHLMLVPFLIVFLICSCHQLYPLLCFLPYTITLAVETDAERFKVNPTSAEPTCLFPASPRSCWTTSMDFATPVAPIGWPAPIKPPLVFTGILPPISDCPSRMN